MSARTSLFRTDRERRRAAATRQRELEHESKARHPYPRLDPVWWIGALFILNFLLMRISVPGLNISVSVPLTIVWLGLAWLTHVTVIEPRRLLLWLVAGGVAAFVTLPQVLFVPAPYVSVNSWLLWMVTWLPAAFMIADRSRGTFNRTMRAIKNIGLALSALSALFILVQFTPIGYVDIIGDYVPGNMVVTGFNTAYPLYYEADLIKSNGWFALEPSFMSFILGLCILAALVVRARIWQVLALALGMVLTAAGSGFFVVLIGGLVMLALGQWKLLRPYILPGAVLGALVVPTVIGQTIVARLSEGESSNSSTALRTVEPYRYLFPEWTADWAIVLFGGGAGSSRYIIDGAGINGLLVPTIGKVLYDYGLIAGALLAALIVVSYIKCTEPAIGISVMVSMLVLQPPAQPLMVPAFLMATLWAPALRNNRPAGTEPDALMAGDEDAATARAVENGIQDTHPFSTPDDDPGPRAPTKVSM